ncbi:MAG: sodium/proton-translocating pyrophosphatase, partial [Chlorobium sp.]
MKKQFNETWLARALPALGGLGVLLQAPNAWASEADLVLPNLHSVSFLGGIPGDTLLLWGLAICLFGMIFGIVQYMGIRNLPVHNAMREISELIYETCKTYLVTQGKFILVLWVLIGAIIVAYFGWLRHLEVIKVLSILAASLVGILGSYTVAWFGMRINTFANSRTAFASLGGKPFPTYAIPLRAGMSIGMLLISIELFVMLCILLFVPNDFAGPCFIGFAIGESLGASVLRIAGGIFTKIADIGSDLMKIVFKIKEDDARNPGVIADCAGDNAGDSVGPTADGFETYGVTGVALISFILLAIKAPEVQIKLLVWIFAMRLVMILASALSYWVNAALAKAKFSNAAEMNFEKPLITLVWLTSIVSIILTYIASWYLISNLGDNTMWWKLASIITCGTIAGALIPELVNRFTSTECAHVRNVVQCSKEGGAALNILAGLVAGNFSAYWMGLAIVGLMGGAYGLSTLGISTLGLTPDLIAAQGLLTVGLDKVIML